MSKAMSRIEQPNEIRKDHNPLGSEPIGKLLKAFALPSVISMLVNAVYNIVDQIFIGQGIGYFGNAATTVCFPIVSIVLAVATLIGAGGSAYAAIKLGEQREEEAQHTLGNVFVLSLISGILLAVIGLVFLEPILLLFGATDANMEYSIQYASIIFLGLPFSVLSISLSNMARTDGSPALSMYSIVIGALLNCILDPLYIFVFEWGVAGAAIATISSQILSAVVLLIYFAILLPGLSPARFVRKAQKAVGTLISDDAEREVFAREMIAAAGDPSRSFGFEMVGPGSNHTPAWFARTQHYACMRGGSPAYIVVRLADVREIRPDEEKRTATTRSGNTRRIHYYTLYTIGFFQTPKAKLPEQAMGFFDMEIRDRALAMLERR